MFLRKDIKKVKTGTVLVPFCKDCDSNEVETIQTCKKCGSHNITVDWQDDRSTKIEYAEKETYVYKCDCCGKEFDGFVIDDIISYNDYGEFVPYKSSFDDYGGNGIHYNLNKDLCNKCKQIIVDKLNKEIECISKEEHVIETLDNILKTKGGK